MKNHERPIKRPRNNHTASEVDFINNIPDDSLRHVYSFLPAKKDRLACCAVSKRWFTLQLDIVSSNLTKSNCQKSPRQVSRNLVGPSLSDLSLVAMLIGIDSDEVLASLSLVGQGPPFQSNSCQITDVGISMLTGGCTRLRAINLCNCTMIGNIGIACIAYNCSSLERIELTNSQLVTDEGLILLVMRCTGLSSLSLGTCRNISNRSLKAIARYSTNLKSIELVNLPLVIGCSIISILLNRIHLATFKIDLINLSDEVLFSSPKKWSLTELKNVSVRNPGHDLTNKGIGCLTRLAQTMENLYLEGFEFAISFSGLMQILVNCRHTIKSLELVRCIASESTCSSDFCPDNHNFLRLQRVRLERCRNISNEFLSMLGQACQCIKEMSLVEIDSITNQGHFVQNLHHADMMCKFEITRCTKIGNPSVWAITRACGSKLKSLIIRNCKLVTDCGVHVIDSRCLKLINLDLGGTRAGDAGVQQIVGAHLFHLEELSLRGCTETTDASLVAIANAPFLISLERVGLLGCTGLTKKELELFESMAYELI